eukprot:644705_1
MKTFLQRICTLAVCVTVVLHSSPVGVLCSDGETEALQERVKQALETLKAMEVELQNDLKGLEMTTVNTRAPVEAELQKVQEIKSTLEAVLVANATPKDASVWKNRGGGFLAGTIFGGVGTLAGKYLLDDLNADAPTGSEDAG